MDIIISNSNGIPIYEQIKNQIKTKIITNELKTGELLPSIRSLAKDLRCSVITTKNAYLELENDGYIKSIPSKGFYVSKINKEIKKEEQLNKIQEKIEESIELAKIYNIDRNILIDMIKILYEENK